eukprot:Gregarina_sp_Poly_1__9021@NODE_54_length_17501_cov_44_565045_g46_i0_p9_GENE_NODE_54_length_17501_cov_44_565045_g46_i0NODE_54_length_17501_cov_44_565045_g46_i0_p9_ORF_typecomplete_len120_score0_40Metallothio_PEC/PF02068_16/6_2Metallothio_PEC/PF02068_16/4_8_NODE_54_length_17501_cov_44_565045_g46_i037034062
MKSILVAHRSLLWIDHPATMWLSKVSHTVQKSGFVPSRVRLLKKLGSESLLLEASKQCSCSPCPCQKLQESIVLFQSCHPSNDCGAAMPCTGTTGHQSSATSTEAASRTRCIGPVLEVL